MQLLLLGTGTITSRLSLTLAEHGHTLAGQMAAFSPQHLDLFDFQGVIVVAPEASVTTESLLRAAERGKFLFILAGSDDGLAAWAHSTGVPAFAFPPTELEIDRLLTEIRRAESGTLAADAQFRRTVLGGDMAARLQSGMVTRKIVVTSPKGGTGKTTTAVNLAVLFALSGLTTYLIDADANAGSLQYHLRLQHAKTTLISLLRQELARNTSVMGDIAAGARYLEAFTPLPHLPTLKVLPGFITDDLGDQALQNEERITGVLQGLLEAGVATGGVVILDVGINPAHVVHRAALRLAEGIAIVIKPEIPDLAETRRWLARMLASLAGVVGREASYEFIGSRVKLCYNQVLGQNFKAAHTLLQHSLKDDHLHLPLTPNGLLPFVAPHLTSEAVNSDRAEDILVWRYKREKPEELAAYVDALVGFASHFVPVVREGAARAGILPPSANGTRKGWLRLFKKG